MTVTSIVLKIIGRIGNKWVKKRLKQFDRVFANIEQVLKKSITVAVT